MFVVTQWHNKNIITSIMKIWFDNICSKDNIGVIESFLIDYRKKLIVVFYF